MKKYKEIHLQAYADGKKLNLLEFNDLINIKGLDYMTQIDGEIIICKHNIEEDKNIYKIGKIKPAQEYCYNDNEHYTQKEINEKIRKRFYNHECYMSDLANSINEIIDYINKENK